MRFLCILVGFCFYLEILLHAKFMLIIIKAPQLGKTKHVDEPRYHWDYHKVKGDHVHTKVLQQIELTVIDLQVIKVSVLDKEFNPVDGLIEARPLVGPPHVWVPVDLSLVSSVMEYIVDGRRDQLMVEVVSVQGEAEASLHQPGRVVRLVGEYWHAEERHPVVERLHHTVHPTVADKQHSPALACNTRRGPASEVQLSPYRAVDVEAANPPQERLEGRL